MNQKNCKCGREKHMESLTCFQCYKKARDNGENPPFYLPTVYKIKRCAQCNNVFSIKDDHDCNKCESCDKMVCPECDKICSGCAKKIGDSLPEDLKLYIYQMESVINTAYLDDGWDEFPNRRYTQLFRK